MIEINRRVMSHRITVLRPIKVEYMCEYTCIESERERVYEAFV